MQYTSTPYDHDHEKEVMYFAQTNSRGDRRKFGIKTDDRRRHIYVIGKTGMGKTTLLENMVVQDINNGHGLCFIDPHGDTANTFLNFIPSHRINDVVYFNPSDEDFPVGFNVFENNGTSKEKNLVSQGLMGVFKKIWGPEVFSARMEYIMLNTVLALLDTPGSTLLGINRMYVDDDYRKRVVSLVQDPSVKAFWVKEFASWEPKYRTEAVAAIQNKVGQFLSSAIIRNIVAQVKSTINVREIMDSRKILICNLAKGMVGEEASRLLGAMLITRLQLAAMERVDIPKESDRQDFYLYVDEFQNFATESFANILSEARKYRLNLIVAHQYIEQLDEKVRAAVFGNVGTLIAYRVGAADAAFMEQEFMPRFTPEDLVNLRKYDIYLKLMIDGASSQPFSASTLPPISQNFGSTEKVIKVSRERYASPRAKIEEKVLQWSGIGPVDDDETKDESMFGGGSINAIDDMELEAKIKELEANSPKIAEYVKPESTKKKKPMFEIACTVCGKVQQLNFEPDWSRPWLCKEDLEKKKAGALPLPAAPVPPEKVQPPLQKIDKFLPAENPAPRPVITVSPKPERTAPPAPRPITTSKPIEIVPPTTPTISLSDLGKHKAPEPPADAIPPKRNLPPTPPPIPKPTPKPPAPPPPVPQHNYPKPPELPKRSIPTPPPIPPRQQTPPRPAPQPPQHPPKPPQHPPSAQHGTLKPGEVKKLD